MKRKKKVEMGLRVLVISAIKMDKKSKLLYTQFLSLSLSLIRIQSFLHLSPTSIRHLIIIILLIIIVIMILLFIGKLKLLSFGGRRRGSTTATRLVGHIDPPWVLVNYQKWSIVYISFHTSTDYWVLSRTLRINQ